MVSLSTYPGPLDEYGFTTKASIFQLCIKQFVPPLSKEKIEWRDSCSRTMKQETILLTWKHLQTQRMSGLPQLPPACSTLNRPRESKWNRNTAQTLKKGRKEIRKLFWPIFTQIKARILIRSGLGSCSAGHGHLAAIRLIGFSQTHMTMPTSPNAIQFRGLPPNSQRLPNVAFSIPVLNLEFKPIQMLYCIHMLFMLTQSRY